MSFTIDDFQDLLRLLEQRPEWRADLRRHVLTEELLALPALVRELADGQAALTRQVEALAAAQARTEQRVDELAAAQARTAEQRTYDEVLPFPVKHQEPGEQHCKPCE